MSQSQTPTASFSDNDFAQMYDPSHSLSNFLLTGPLTSSPVTIASRTCMIAADVLVIIITWAATYRMRGFRLNSGIGRTLSAVLFEYG